MGCCSSWTRPQAIYDHPANIFVAGFIGCPAMNFFDVGALILRRRRAPEGDGFEPDAASGSWPRGSCPSADKRLVLGIRPEHLDRLSQGENEAYGEIPATVEVVESMGSEQYVYASIGAKTFVSRLDAGVPVKMGDRVRLAYPKARVQLFDAESERNILVG